MTRYATAGERGRRSPVLRSLAMQARSLARRLSIVAELTKIRRGRMRMESRDTSSLTSAGRGSSVNKERRLNGGKSLLRIRGSHSTGWQQGHGGIGLYSPAGQTIPITTTA